MFLIISLLIAFYGFIGNIITGPAGGNSGMRSRDASIKSTINKSALATSGYINAYGKVPNDEHFIKALNNVEREIGCRDLKDNVCLYLIEGYKLNNTCNESNWAGKGNHDCFYRYEGSNEDLHYKLWAKSSNKDILYMFDSSEGGMLNCDINNPYECKKVE